jgi:acyl transferase domain-containing protein
LHPWIEDSKPAVMTRTGQKTAFAFAGGGSLGAIQVGMLRGLLSAGVQPDFVVGASAGAINAAYFAGPERGRRGEARGNLVWPAARRRLSGHVQKCIRSAQASR